LCNWVALPQRPSWREMCGAVHDQTCRSDRNHHDNNPHRYRGMQVTRGAARTRDLAAAAAPASVSAPGITLCSLGCISFHFDSAPPPTSRFASTHAAEANLNASRFCLHGGSCPTPPSCTTAALYHTQREQILLQGKKFVFSRQGWVIVYSIPFVFQ